MATSFPASKWITFLRKYGPVPTNDNMYDEAIQRSLRHSDVEPIKLPSAYLDRVIQNLETSPPRSVLLTGTAGDGKTFHCREVYAHFGGDPDTWNEGKPVQRVMVGDHELNIVKDLSEFPDDAGRKFTEFMANDIAGLSTKRIYLVAANHGQLLEKLNQAARAQRVAELREQVVEAMVTGENPDTSPLAVYDLSKASGIDVLKQITSAILDHPGWNACNSCPLNAQTPRCPIRENRSRMAGEDDGRLLQQRLTSLVKLSELNDVHYPIRQLLALTANMLLGHPTATDGLMTCRTAARVLADDDYDRATVYGNIFGENLKRRADKSEPFTKLRSFGIGEETNNAVDSILVYGNDDPALKDHFVELLLTDTVYGATPSYLAAQTAYLEGAEGGRGTDFLDYLRHARQRLFFRIASDSAMEPLLWDLTVFRFAGDFLETAEQLRDGGPATRRVMGKVVKGLNRVFAGMLIEDDQQVVVASAGSHSQSRTSHIVDAFISVTPRLGERVELTWSAGRIVLSISVAPPVDVEAVVLPLTLLRFEFLCRVADGALPSSFSRECYEDLLDYKARLFRALQERDGVTRKWLSGDEVVINFLDVGPDGRARQEPVGVKIR